jgi:purine-binding chemotaxis protein CheW
MDTKSFSSFLLNDQLFGLDILLVREISKQLNITPVPMAPEYIRGLINLRGQIVTVLDLRQRLGLGENPVTSDSCNIVLKSEMELSTIRGRDGREDLFAVPDKVGLLVDAIGDVITVDSKMIDAPPANMGEIDGKFLTGVAKLDETLMAILDVTKILEP